MDLTFRGGIWSTALSVTLGNGGLGSLMNINEQVHKLRKQVAKRVISIKLDAKHVCVK